MFLEVLGWLVLAIACGVTALLGIMLAWLTFVFSAVAGWARSGETWLMSIAALGCFTISGVCGYFAYEKAPFVVEVREEIRGQ